MGGDSPIFLCSLSWSKVESCPWNLELEGDESVAFSVIGPQSIYLSGYFRVDSKDDDAEYYDTDSDGEDIVETDEDESSYDTEDDYENEFVDDSDLEMFSPSNVPNSGVVIEEIVEDEKPATGSNQSKRLKKSQLNESDDNKNFQCQIVAKSGNGVQVLESEDEDGFPIAGSHKGKSDEQKLAAKGEEREDKKTTKEAKKKKSQGAEREVPEKNEGGQSEVKARWIQISRFRENSPIFKSIDLFTNLNSLPAFRYFHSFFLFRVFKTFHFPLFT